MVTIFDLTNPTVAHKAHEAAKIQSRVVACFTQGPPGFALGLVEGRTMIEYFEAKDQ